MKQYPSAVQIVTLPQHQFLFGEYRIFSKSQFSSCRCERSEAISCLQAIFGDFSWETASAEVVRLATLAKAGGATTSNS